MEDSRIVDLYWQRDESAISESDRKYGRMLNVLSFSLLSSREDAEECVNDTYIDAWNSMHRVAETQRHIETLRLCVFVTLRLNPSGELFLFLFLR